MEEIAPSHSIQNELTLRVLIVISITMSRTMTDDQVTARRSRVLASARWCFLNFGFAKTSFDDIASRANLSRTLLYKQFKSKDDAFKAVFSDWLVSRHEDAKRASEGSGTQAERLFDVCRLLVLEPWAEMAGAPMGTEFFAACEQIDPESEALHHKVALKCATRLLGDPPSAEVFLLALDGLLTDHPTPAVLERRTRLLVQRFLPLARKAVRT